MRGSLINNSNPWFAVFYPEEECGYDLATVTVADGYGHGTGSNAGGYFAWADVNFFQAPLEPVHRRPGTRGEGSARLL